MEDGVAFLWGIILAAGGIFVRVFGTVRFRLVLARWIGARPSSRARDPARRDVDFGLWTRLVE